MPLNTLDTILHKINNQFYYIYYAIQHIVT